MSIPPWFTNAYLNARFGDFDEKRDADSPLKDVEPSIGPGIKNLLDGSSSYYPAAVDTCNTSQLKGAPSNISQLESTSSKSDLQPTVVGSGTATSDNSTLDTESFHTVCNDSSSASIAVEEVAGEKLSQTHSSESCESEQKEGVVKESESDEIINIEGENIMNSVSMKSCTLNIGGVVLTIQSPESAAVSYPAVFPFVPLTNSCQQLVNFLFWISSLFIGKQGRRSPGRFPGQRKQVEVVEGMFCFILLSIIPFEALRRSREEILRLAASPFSQLPPQDWVEPQSSLLSHSSSSGDRCPESSTCSDPRKGSGGKGELQSVQKSRRKESEERGNFHSSNWN